ncbi:histone demethylase [Aureococcus anophagefferens]|nr:histone demethylase [Aureococcus anophagefferens]
MDASHSSGGQSRAALKRKKKHKNKAKQQQQPLTEGSRRQIFAPDADDLKLPRVSSQDFDDEALDALYGTLRAEVTLDRATCSTCRGPAPLATAPRRASTSRCRPTAPTRGSTSSSASCPRPSSAQRGDCGLRKALPRDYAHFLGVAHAGDDGDDDDEPADDDDDDDDGDDDDDDGSVAEVAAVAYDEGLVMILDGVVVVDKHFIHYAATQEKIDKHLAFVTSVAAGVAPYRF